MQRAAGRRPALLVGVVVTLIGVVGLGLAAVAVVRLTNAPATQPTTPAALADPLLAGLPTPMLSPTPGSVIVYISGAVQQPDVYELPYDARVKDVVLVAGGLLDSADSNNINLAARIEDEQHIHIPHIGESTQPATTRGAAGATGAPAESGSGLLNLNTATAADLEELPGVGQVMAGRIVEYRSANGPFTAVEELQQVTGIGPSLFEKISPLVTVE